MVAGKAGKPTIDFPAGTQFGALTVVQRVNTMPNASGGQKYRLRCICGERITKPRFYLVRQHNPLRHCGCMTPKADEPYTKRSWYAMHLRCYYVRHVAYKHYGGRGIEVDWRWHRDNPEGWENFKKDMGIRPQGMSIDRYPDVNGNYKPGNCRWATSKQQSNNQRRHMVTPDDEDVTT